MKKGGRKEGRKAGRQRERERRRGGRNRKEGLTGVKGFGEK